MAEKKPEEMTIWERVGKPEMNDRKGKESRQRLDALQQEEERKKKRRQGKSIWDTIGQPEMNSDLDE